MVPALGVLRSHGQWASSRLVVFGGEARIAGIRTIGVRLVLAPVTGVVPIRLDHGVLIRDRHPLPRRCLLLQFQIEVIPAVPHVQRIAIRSAVDPVLVQEQIGDRLPTFGRGEIDLPWHLVDTGTGCGLLKHIPVLLRGGAFRQQCLIESRVNGLIRLHARIFARPGGRSAAVVILALDFAGVLPFRNLCVCIHFRGILYDAYLFACILREFIRETRISPRIANIQI